MSALLGTLSGALVASGVYYGFSNLMQSRTLEHRNDLHNLSLRLAGASTIVPAPPPASALIVRRPFLSLLQRSWNEHLETLFNSVSDFDERAVDYGRSLLTRAVQGASEQPASDSVKSSS